MKYEILTYEQLFREYRKLYKDYGNFAIFYSKCIKLMHQIIRDIDKIDNKEYLKTKKNVGNVKAISEFYEIKILHNFVAHKVLLKNGISISSYNQLRSIYETIIKIYLNITYPDLGELNFKYETRESNKELSEEQIDDIEKEYSTNKFLKASFIEQKLYSKDILKFTRDFYRRICNFVHPSISSMSACYEFKPNTFIESYKTGIGLTISNFIILFELHGDKIKNRYKQKLLEIVKEYPKFIPEGVLALIPSNNNNKLKIKNYNELIDILEKLK